MDASLVGRPRLWWAVLGYGLLLWVITVAALALTGNTALVPSVILTGSFVTPVALTVWLAERQRYSGASPDGAASQLTPLLLVVAFLGAGVGGVAVSSVFESVVPTSPQARFFLAVAAIEETVKFMAVWWLARGFPVYLRRDGMVLGACVGFGFAAFETAGYVFNAVVAATDESASSLLSVVGTEVVRSILTPVGHGLWTALLAGALFAAADGARLRVTGSVVGWWVVVVLLHFAWNEAGVLATTAAEQVTRRVAPIGDLDATGPDPATVQGLAHGAILAVLLLACAGVGFWLAHHEWVKGRARVAGYPYAP
ncbi:MAG: PrsW family glutamic-type intramembrane protease [Candidatus Nanopelagicales bacterium]